MREMVSSNGNWKISEIGMTLVKTTHRVKDKKKKKIKETVYRIGGWKERKSRCVLVPDKRKVSNYMISFICKTSHARNLELTKLLPRHLHFKITMFPCSSIDPLELVLNLDI